MLLQSSIYFDDDAGDLMKVRRICYLIIYIAAGAVPGGECETTYITPGVLCNILLLL